MNSAGSAGLSSAANHVTNRRPVYYRALRIAKGYATLALLLMRHLPIWLVGVVRSWSAHRKGIRIHKDDRVRAMVSISAEGIVYYRGPYSTGIRCVIPAGTVLRVYSDTDDRTLAFACTFVNAADEHRLVPEGDRADSKYAGVAFAFDLADVGRRLEILPRAERVADVP